MPPRNSTASGKSSKPAVKTSTGKSTKTKTRAASSAAAKSGPKAKQPGLITPEDRLRFIAEAAYFKAEQRSFAEGNELEDWVEAEAEIDALLDSRGAG
jgi:hypothetical protein